MPDFKTVWTAKADAVITQAGLAAGAGRISTQIKNTSAADGTGAEGVEAELLRIWWRVRSGAVAPALGAPYLLYLIRSDNATPEHVSEGLGLVDAAVSVQPNNSDIVCSIPAIATAGKDHYCESAIPNPGPRFSFLAWNGSLQTWDATAANFWVRYSLGFTRQV